MTGGARRAGLSSQGAWGSAILVIAILLLGAAAALPYAWLSYTNTRLGEARTELQFVEARINASKGGTQVKLTAADNIDPLFASGATSGLALAGLQRLLGSLASANGMAVIRTQPLQTEHGDGLAVLRMEVEASGSIDNLRGFLLAIETGEPLIFVNQAQIAASEKSGDTGGFLPSDKLSVTLQVEAFGWWEAAP